MQKATLIFTLIILSSLFTYAQRPGGQRANMPSIGRLYGKIVDAKTKQPVEFATVTLLAMQKDSAINGGLAKANGDFSMDKLPFGRFRLRVSFIGYKTINQQVSITSNNMEQDLGNIAITVDAEVLKEVVVEGERASVIMAIDRRIYNVDKDISARGGTGVDAIKNIPGLTVDADGGVTLRNSSPTIFVDGRPTTLTLEQIPSDQIDRIEVITNPSAKFDASTTGGILNIVMKKNTRPGYNGVIMLGAGWPKRYNLMGSLNIKEGKGNLGISYSLNNSANTTKGFTDRTSLNNGIETGFYTQNNNNYSSRLFQNARLSYDYNISNRTSATLSGGYTSGSFNNNDKQSFTQQDGGKSVLLTGDRLNDQLTSWDNYNGQFQLRHLYPKRGKEWTSDVNYSKSFRNTESDFITNNYDATGGLIAPGTQFQNNDGGGTSDNYTFQFDFTNPVTDTIKWEFGVRSNYKIDRSLLDVSVKDNATGEFLADTTLSNNYKINDMVNAAYVTYSNMFGGIAYQAGLRFEQTRFNGEIINKNQEFEYYYPKGFKNLEKALFPSLYLTKRVGEKHEMQLNFSRKIKRPGWMEVMPFIMFADKLNYRIGNPNLAPEFTNTAELNYNRIFAKGNFFTALYIKQTENNITNYSYRLPSDSTILVNSFINGNTSYNYGFENNIKWSFFDRKLDATFNINVFFATISATVGGVDINNNGFMYNTKGILSYKLPKQYTVQVNGGYESPKVVPQGTTTPVYSMDISLNKEITKTLSFNLVVNDIFNTRRHGSFFESATISQETSRRRDTRNVRLSVTWRFGEMDRSLFKRKSQRQGDGGGMDMDF